MKRRRKSRKRSWPRLLFWLLVVVPVIVLGTLALLNWVVMPLVTRYGKEVAVPDMLGMTQADAEAGIAAAGLTLGNVRVVDDTAFAPGCVVSQQPPPGRLVKPGRLVQLDISRGANRLTVPDVAGLSTELARSLLEEVGLVVVEVESLRMPNLPPGQVIATRPVAGHEVERGATIVLAVSSSVGEFPMPNLLGTNLETARGIIASQGLVLGSTREAPSDEPVGLVLVQYPEEGIRVRDADTVYLIVAAPPLPDSAPQPDSLPRPDSQP